MSNQNQDNLTTQAMRIHSNPVNVTYDILLFRKGIFEFIIRQLGIENAQDIVLHESYTDLKDDDYRVHITILDNSFNQSSVSTNQSKVECRFGVEIKKAYELDRKNNEIKSIADLKLSNKARATSIIYSKYDAIYSSINSYGIDGNRGIIRIKNDKNKELVGNISITNQEFFSDYDNIDINKTSDNIAICTFDIEVVYKFDKLSNPKELGNINETIIKEKAVTNVN